MTRAHPYLPWCRYADDGLVHCRSELEAETLKVELQARLAECGLEMHPTKTKIDLVPPQPQPVAGHYAISLF
jgi:RNA-directed DNA polymerase